MNKLFLKLQKTSLRKARKLRQNMTDTERKLWFLLRDKQLEVHFRRQVPVGPYIVDFICRKVKLIVELDGSQHFEKKSLIYDSKRDGYLRERGFVVLRFNDRELLSNSEGVRGVIYEHIRNKMED